MPRIKKVDIFPDYIRVRDPDQALLAKLTIRAMGNRSLNYFSSLCGVNPSTLSRLVNQKNSGPCSDTLIKAIADNAAPESGVTLELLLDAHGLAPIVVHSSSEGQFQTAAPSSSEGTCESISLQHKDPMFALNSPNLLDSKRQNLTMVDRPYATKSINVDYEPIQIPSEVVVRINDVSKNYSGSADLARRATGKMKMDFKKNAQNIIVADLVDQGYVVKLDLSAKHPNRNGEKTRRFDFVLTTDALRDREIDQWCFAVKPGVYSTGSRFLNELFGDLYLDSLFDERKAVSLVIGDANAFKSIRKNYQNIVIYDYVSIILLDRTFRQITDEIIFQQKGADEYKTVFNVAGLDSADADNEENMPDENLGE